MTKFVFYGRVAAEDQQDTKKFQGEQLARCLAYLKARGWENVAVYADDTQGGDTK
jgi:DNA invertase Pin-like site-specific DNA recombinase